MMPFRRFPSRGHATAGFSAVELLVVLFIIGILAAISGPSMMTFFSGMKIRTAAQRLQSHLRLCRQMAVSKRIDVVMLVQRTNGTTTPYYQAWEERSSTLVGRLTRQPNGADNTANTVDDERWVIKKEEQMAVDKVKFTDTYNDTTPDDPNDAVSGTIMSSSGLMHLRFGPNGQVTRIDETTGADVSPSDTQVRMRLRRKVTRTRVDQWDVTINGIGKVGSNFYKGTTPE